MADRYWVGGTASWDGTAGVKWSTTSGGAGGASVPTSADDVFFDAASTGTCTISSGNTGAKSINFTGFTGALAGTASITVSGSVTLSAVMTLTYTGALRFNASGTLTSNGKALHLLYINGSGITVTLGDDLNVSFYLDIITGTISAGSYNATVANLQSIGTNSRGIQFGTGVWTLTGSNPLNFGTAASES